MEEHSIIHQRRRPFRQPWRVLCVIIDLYSVDHVRRVKHLIDKIASCIDITLDFNRCLIGSSDR